MPRLRQTKITKVFCKFESIYERWVSAVEKAQGFWSTAILAVGSAGILSAAGRTRCGEPAGSRPRRRDAREPHRLEACAPTAKRL